MSQKHDVLEYMRAGNKITPLEAARELGCRSLAARALDLRKDGYEIHCNRLQVSKKTNVSQYYMENN